MNEYRKESKTEDKSENEDKRKSGLRYYPMIYGLHIVAIILLLLIEAILFLKEPLDFKTLELHITLIKISSLLFSLAGLFLLVYFGIKAHPNRVREYFNFEENEVAKTLKNME